MEFPKNIINTKMWEIINKTDTLKPFLPQINDCIIFFDFEKGLKDLSVLLWNKWSRISNLTLLGNLNQWISGYGNV